MKKLSRFAFNYPHNFVQECWGSGHIADHLQSKFNSCYENYGPRAAIISFISQLDHENEQKLYTYIDGCYDDEK